ncbi:ABC transporter ATP-binding protein [Microvirga lotononidis]|uniref:ABC-type nitrate/sulfonate/bicarbonate transport system, ATPase component n=1 Tax=Microvirga lotononidis TaxID=864069 RepID=I4YUC3_9HYPH|nr:ABC transporter ATP-binding protein [Microvirga lotononidis]EIM27565.1 ABC-type nitrate/sulfonate/bicarbonate transport system, ATPase component [Microvirga lotononidis]WQO28286.1 ABC transporter ATP-binding protein [Microvirga lotononidis]
MLNLEHLSKTYADGTRALSDINLVVQEGEIVSLIGGSGCGKTTLLRLVAGLDPASAGRISLDDEVLSGPHPAVGIVFQEPRLLPWLSVADNIAFGLDGLTAAEKKARVAHALDKIGLAEHADRWPRDLSGGQQQRVSIARAFVTNPKVLLLDEPFSALDAFTRASLHDHLLGLWEETRPTVVLVTHDVQEAVTLADRAVVMQPKPGRIFDELPLTLARPRDKAGLPFETSVRRILTALDHSLKAPQSQPQRERDRQAAALWW